MRSLPNEAWARIRCLVLDCDGVMTPATLLYGPGRTWKVFHAHDGQAVKMWRRAGGIAALVSGRDDEAVARRAGELGFDHVVQGCRDKNEAYLGIRDRFGLADDEICAVGDDLPDLPMIRRAGIGVAVPNACREALETADWTTTRAGGQGAVREVIETILRASGRWSELLRRYEDREEDRP